MSRWDNYPASNQIGGQQYDQQVQASTVTQNYVQSGSGNFVRAESDGPNSDYVRCIYQPKTGGTNFLIMCDKTPGCCAGGCCPKDTLMMEALYVLIAFVIIVAALGLLIGIICYARSKGKQKKEQKYNSPYPYSQYGDGSQVGLSGYHSPVYSTYAGPTPVGRY